MLQTLTCAHAGPFELPCACVLRDSMACRGAEHLVQQLSGLELLSLMEARSASVFAVDGHPGPKAAGKAFALRQIREHDSRHSQMIVLNGVRNLRKCTSVRCPDFFGVASGRLRDEAICYVDMICCDPTPTSKLSVSGEEPAFQRLAVGQNGALLGFSPSCKSSQASHRDVQAAEHPRRPLAWKAIYALSVFVGTIGRRASFKPSVRGWPSCWRRWENCDGRQTKEGVFVPEASTALSVHLGSTAQLKTRPGQLLVRQSGPRPKKGQSRGAALHPPALSASVGAWKGEEGAVMAFLNACGRLNIQPPEAPVQKFAFCRISGTLAVSSSFSEG